MKKITKDIRKKLIELNPAETPLKLTPLTKKEKMEDRIPIYKYIL